MNFIDVTLKLANMAKPQEFTLYPCTAKDTLVSLQSDKRMLLVDITTGQAIISSKNTSYPNTAKLRNENIKFTVPDCELSTIRGAVNRMVSRTREDGSFPLT